LQQSKRAGSVPRVVACLEEDASRAPGQSGEWPIVRVVLSLRGAQRRGNLHGDCFASLAMTARTAATRDLHAFTQLSCPVHVLPGPLVVFAAVTSLTPGPNVVLVTASAANFGFGRTVPQMLGITGGFWVLVMAVELGLAGLVPRRAAHSDSAAICRRTGRTRGLHDRGRRRAVGNLGHCRGTCRGLLRIGGDLGRVRRGASAPARQSAHAPGVQLVDGRSAGFSLVPVFW
jgi:hypothetical protein